MEKPPVITQEEFRQQYNERKPHYERLAANIQDVLKSFLAEKAIPYLEVLARVKDVDSAYEKISRKEYNKPFEQIEDWCGLRIICYYPSDIDRIGEMLGEEFDIRTQEDTAKRLAAHEFGYRSTHFILKIKPEWAAAPNYRQLQDYKAEVQVRTILMHAWAEIEHKLSYKSAEQVPDQFRRKLFRLSAKFEEADEQFEELRRGIGEYQAIISEAVKDTHTFRFQELNLDTLQAFLDFAFPDYGKDKSAAGYLVEELVHKGFTMKEIVDTYDLARNALRIVELEFERIDPQSHPPGYLLQVGCLNIILDVGSDRFFIPRYLSAHGTAYQPWIQAITAGRASVGKIVPERAPG